MHLSSILRYRRDPNNMTIVGVSGSPIVNGNTDRIVKALLEQSGKEYIFINLSTLRYDPCRACAHLCAKTNICPLDDDLKPYFEPILNSEALILGTSVNGGNITGWMFSFLTRLWCFHHVKNLLRYKPVLLVATGLFKRSEYRVMARFLERVPSENIIGHIYYTSNIPPCYTCGMGKVCKVGGLWAMVGRDEERLKKFKITPDKFKRWEDNPETVEKVARYAKILAEL